MNVQEIANALIKFEDIIEPKLLVKSSAASSAI